jgi:MFS family permease
MSRTDHSSIKIADKELAAWLIVSQTTQVADELPLISMSAVLLLVLAFAARCVLGLGFDRIYDRMSSRRWQQFYAATVLVNTGTWGALNALLIWYYFPSWPAYLVSFCTAGLAAGGSTALYTHLDCAVHTPAPRQGFCCAHARAQPCDLDADQRGG